jgi:hypothetical protein
LWGLIFGGVTRVSVFFVFIFSVTLSFELTVFLVAYFEIVKTETLQEMQKAQAKLLTEANNELEKEQNSN